MESILHFPPAALWAFRVQRHRSLCACSRHMAHAFNNVLMGVSGYAELLLARLTAEAAGREEAVKLQDVASSGAARCRTWMGWASAELSNPSAVSLDQLAASTAQTADGQQNPNVKASLQPATVWGDLIQLNWALNNLMENGIEAAPGQPVNISAGTCAPDNDGLQSILPAGAAHWAYLQVADTGCGMDEELQQRIFEPFFTTKPKRQGLGLFNVLRVALAHRGAVTVFSRPSEGTAVRLLLPPHRITAAAQG